MPHTVPLPPLAVEALEELWRWPQREHAEVAHLPLGGPGYAFESPRRAGSPIGRVSRSFRRWKQGAEVGGGGADLRRTVNTTMARLGVRHEVKKPTMNHAPDDVNKRHYDRYDHFHEKADALTRWARHVERLLTGAEAEGEVAEFPAGR